jgi:hypothetical protein
VAKSVDLDLADTVRMIQRFSKMIDAAWQKARSTSAPGGLVMALDEASLGLHRARIALSHSLSETAIPMTPASRRRAGWLGNPPPGGPGLDTGGSPMSRLASRRWPSADASTQRITDDEGDGG